MFATSQVQKREFLIFLFLSFQIINSGESMEIKPLRFVPCHDRTEKRSSSSFPQCLEIKQFFRKQSRFYRAEYQDADEETPKVKSSPYLTTFQKKYVKPITNAEVYTFIDKISEALLNRNIMLFDSTLNNLELYYRENKTALSILLNQKLNFTEGYNLMHLAVQARGSYSIYFMKRLHNYGVDWNRLGPGNISCLFLAVKLRNIRAFEWLLPLSTSIYNIPIGNKGENVLFGAVRYFHEEILRRLLNAGMSSTSLSAENATPLHIAIQQRNIKAIRLLLNYDLLHMQRDIYGKTLIDYAIETKNYPLVERLVHHKHYNKQVLESQLVNHKDSGAVRRILRLFRRVSALTLKKLIEAETQRMNMAICVRATQGQTLLWRLARFLLWLPATRRTPANQKTFSEIFHILLNFYTYVRVTRYPMYKLCNPHVTGYLGPKSFTENRSYGRIPLDFLLFPSHFLSNDTALIARFYVAMDPANENSLIARLARHNFNVFSLTNVIQNKPQQLSMRVFLLGRSGHLDGCSVAATRKLWVAVRTCAIVLKKCLKLSSSKKDSSGSSIETVSHMAWIFNESTALEYKMLHDTCDVSFRRMVLQFMASEEYVAVARLFSDDVEYASKILSESPIRANRHVKRNLYLIKLFPSKNKTFTSVDQHITPIENVFFSYLSDKFATGNLTDHRYLKAIVNSPYISLSKPQDIKRAFEILGEAALYGFVKTTRPYRENRASLMDLPLSWSSLLPLLRHPLIKFGSNFVFAYSKVKNEAQKKLHQPALMLASNLWNKTYTDSEEAQWALSLLGGADSRQIISSFYDTERPSNAILSILLERRKKLIRIVASSPSTYYDRDMYAAYKKALFVLCYLYLIRLFFYTAIALIVSRKILGETIARYVACSSVDFWQVVYPAHRGFKAFFFGVACGFLGRLGSRHHPHGFITSCLHVIQLTISVFSIVVLYAWALWTGEWLFVQCVIVLQVVAILVAWFSSSSITDRGSMLLMASLCPCSMEDLQTSVFLSESELLNWNYKKSAGISTEEELNTVISEEVRCMRMFRSLVSPCSVKNEQHPNPFSVKNLISRQKAHFPFENLYNDTQNIWKTTSDQNVGDVIQITRELAGYAKLVLFQNPIGLTGSQPLPYIPKSNINSSTQCNRFIPSIRVPWRSNTLIKSPILNKKFFDFKLKLQKFPLLLLSRKRHICIQNENPFRLGWHKCNSQHSKYIQLVSKLLSHASQREQKLYEALRAVGITSAETFPQRKQWECCGVTPPEFLHDKDDNICLGGVRVPQEFITRRQERKILEQWDWFNDEDAVADNESLGDKLTSFADILRIQRQQILRFNGGLIDTGHLSYKELTRFATHVNTMDYLVLFHRYIELRRFSTQVFFAGLAKYSDYVMVVILFETISFVCSIAPLIVCICTPREYRFVFRELYGNSFSFIITKKIPSLSAMLLICRCNVYNRLLKEIFRSAALHVILSRQAYHVGSMFTWQALQPYLVFEPTKIMRSIWNIRRVAFRKLDNMIELTSHQFNFLVFCLLAGYPLFVFVLISIPDTLSLIKWLFHIYLLLVAVALCIITTTLFGFLGYRALHEFTTLSDWIHRIVDPVRTSQQPLMFLADKNQMDPTLNYRCLTIIGFRFTTNVVIVVVILFGAASLILGLMLFKVAVNETLDTSVVA